MQPVSAVFAQPTQPAVPGMPAGAGRMATRYYDSTGRLRTSRTPVPVDQYGMLAGVEFSCRRCRVSRWFPVGLKGIPTCEVCDRRMEPGTVKRAALLPWRELWDVCERPLRPVWALPALAAAGYAVDAAPVPAIALLAAAPVVGELARRVAGRQEIRAKVARGRLEEDDPEGGKRLRAAIARQARAVGYTSAGATAWLALAAGLGMDPHTVGGKISLVALGLMWAWPAATWWRKLRRERNRPAPVVEQVAPTETGAPTFGEIIAKQWANTVGAVARQQQALPPATPGEQPTIVPAVPAGALPSTVLENVHRVTGGWAATIVDPLQIGREWVTESVRRQIAAKFKCGISAVTLEPEADDTNRCFLMVQPQSPLRDPVRWDGPAKSIDVRQGTAMLGRYADGSKVLYEVYRPGFGSPHVFVCGTTGSGKSELLCDLFKVERWFGVPNADGAVRGLVCSFLIDPQQGQSFEPFMDDLAAPVATTIDEAMLLVRALDREALRRNAYLSKKGWRDANGVLHRAEWVDGKGRKRAGRKWWNPLVDGPILSLTIDEAHDYLTNKEFVHLITKGGRMWRKCGMQIKVATHTPLLSDLGGSMALRDMLTGGFVWVLRTANGLTGPTAFNGRLPVDPRQIPAVPGMGYVLTQQNPRAMVARATWEEDYYDLVRDEDDKPIGCPGVLPEVTVDTFGPEFAKWMATGEAPAQQQAPDAQQGNADGRAVDYVVSALAASPEPLDMDALMESLKRIGSDHKLRTVRDALKQLRDAGWLESSDGLHRLTAQGREHIEAQLAEKREDAEVTP